MQKSPPVRIKDFPKENQINEKENSHVMPTHYSVQHVLG